MLSNAIKYIHPHRRPRALLSAAGSECPRTGETYPIERQNAPHGPDGTDRPAACLRLTFARRFLLHDDGVACAEAQLARELRLKVVRRYGGAAAARCATAESAFKEGYALVTDDCRVRSFLIII